MDHVQEPDADTLAFNEMKEKLLLDSQKKLIEKIGTLKQSQQSKCQRCEEEINRILKDLESEIKQQLISMSIRIAEMILGRELPDAASLQHVIEDVLAPISDLQGVRVRMTPESIELLGNPELSTVSHRKIEFVADIGLKPGDVIVESRNGIFDGRLRSRLDHLAEVLSQPSNSKETTSR